MLGMIAWTTLVSNGFFGVGRLDGRAWAGDSASRHSALHTGPLSALRSSDAVLRENAAVMLNRAAKEYPQDQGGKEAKEWLWKHLGQHVK